MMRCLLDEEEKPKSRPKSIKCKIRVLCPLHGVYPAYQPEVGKVYVADYRKGRCVVGQSKNAPVCVIPIRDKLICLKPYEYEILKDGECDV